MLFAHLQSKGASPVIIDLWYIIANGEAGMLLKSCRVLVVIFPALDPSFSLSIFSFTSLAVNKILSTELALKSGSTVGTLLVYSLVNIEPKY